MKLAYIDVGRGDIFMAFLSLREKFTPCLKMAPWNIHRYIQPRRKYKITILNQNRNLASSVLAAKPVRQQSTYIHTFMTTMRIIEYP
jgi:hypothetical protein